MTKIHYWFFLLVSIVFEVTGTSIMKFSQESWPLIGLGCMYLLLGFSYFFLAKAVVRLPIGVAYAFWEGFGLLLITMVSITILGEHISALKAVALLMVFCGTMLVHRGTESGHAEPALQGGASC